MLILDPEVSWHLWQLWWLMHQANARNCLLVKTNSISRERKKTSKADPALSGHVRITVVHCPQIWMCCEISDSKMKQRRSENPRVLGYAKLNPNFWDSHCFAIFPRRTKLFKATELMGSVQREAHVMLYQKRAWDETRSREAWVWRAKKNTRLEICGPDGLMELCSKSQRSGAVQQRNKSLRKPENKDKSWEWCAEKAKGWRGINMNCDKSRISPSYWLAI